eukprot:4872325-Prymnesium_polylepis.1
MLTASWSSINSHTPSDARMRNRSSGPTTWWTTCARAGRAQARQKPSSSAHAAGGARSGVEADRMTCVVSCVVRA